LSLLQCIAESCCVTLVVLHQVKLYESQRVWKVESDKMKLHCKQLSDELTRHKQLLSNTEHVSCQFSDQFFISLYRTAEHMTC